jgi:steroid delta-isomerase-like uncharacterized protein
MPTGTVPDSEATVRTFYEALNTGDTTLVDQALADGWEAVPALRTGPGSRGWKASIEHLRGVFTGLTVTIEDIIISGDRAAVRSVCRGTHTGELLGVPGTGKPVEFRATDLHRLEDGRIAQTWHLEDHFGIATQIGLTFTATS